MGVGREGEESEEEGGEEGVRGEERKAKRE